jgi:hypothetical protein
VKNEGGFEAAFRSENPHVNNMGKSSKTF